MTDKKRFIGIDIGKRSFEVVTVSNNNLKILLNKYKKARVERQVIISSFKLAAPVTFKYLQFSFGQIIISLSISASFVILY